MDSLAPEVLRFWFGEGPEHGKSHKRWFVKDAAFDAEITKLFLPLHEELVRRKICMGNSRDCLARIVVLDQFPRNMFRGTARAFASDPLALESARLALERGWDRGMLPVEQLFVYLPFEHSESLADQELCCELMKSLDPEQLRYALRHKEIIERFGRFPHRNALLGRASTPEEIEFLKQPGSGF